MQLVRDSSMPCEEYSESIFRFSHLLIRELIKELSPNQAICSRLVGEIHYLSVHSDCKQQEEYLLSIFEIFTPID